MRDALPNASFIGFTGTPIETTEQNTQAVIGHYLTIQDNHQAVNHQGTLPALYESRLAKLIFISKRTVRPFESFS